MDRSLDEVDVRLGSDDDHLSREEHYSSERRSRDDRDRSRSPRGRPFGGDAGEGGSRGGGGGGNKRVYVSNLHYDVKSKDLKTVFRRVGHIVWATVKEVRDGVSKGCGLVEYVDEESARRAIKELDGMKLLGRAVRVREDSGAESFEFRRENTHRRTPPRSASPSCTVFVSNLEYGVGWQKLKDIFKVAGRVSNVEIFTDKGGRSKGTAMVQFEDPGSAHNSIALFHGQMLQDRPMIVKMDRRAGLTPDPLAIRLDRLSQMSGMPSYGGDSYGGDYRDQRDYSNQRYPRDYGSSSRDYRDNRDFRDTRDSRDSRESRDYREHRDYDRYSRSSDYSQSRYPSGSDRYDRHDRFDYDRSGDYGGHRQDRQEGAASSYSILGPPPPIPPSPRHASKTDRQLFITNLSFRSTWQSMKDHFKRAGRVDHTDVLTTVDGKPKGCGTVLFSSRADAARAIDLLNGSDLDGRRIDVKYDKYA